jgi:hypothetical protein
MDDRREVRIEDKIDALTELITTHVAEDKAVAASVIAHDAVIRKLKTKQDQQDGATALIGFLAATGLIGLAIDIIARHWK